MSVSKPHRAVLGISTIATSGLLFIAPVVTSPVVEAQAVSRNCPGDNYVTLYTDFNGMRSYLDKMYRRNGRVWQAPNDEAVWRVWCGATKGTAILNGDTSIPKRITLNDGTRVSFRAGSNSGGYTVDINSLNHTKLFKVHVER